MYQATTTQVFYRAVHQCGSPTRHGYRINKSNNSRLITDTSAAYAAGWALAAARECCGRVPRCHRTSAGRSLQAPQRLRRQRLQLQLQ